MNKKQIRYFYNGYQWLTEDMYSLDKFQEQIMFKETEEGQMMYPYYDKHEYRTDIRYKLESYE
jgi:hypothetical protein